MTDESRGSEDLRSTVEHLSARVDETFQELMHAFKRVRASQKGVERGMWKLAAQVAHVAVAFDPAVDPHFLEAAVPLVTERRTMLGYDRLYTLWQAAANVGHLHLPAVEAGTFRGGSAALLAEALGVFGGGTCELHVVDTFEGHLDATLSSHDDVERQRGKFQATSVEDVRHFLGARPGTHVHQGDVTEVIRTWPERQYGLVHLDVDLYQPTLESLRYFGPRMATGGVLIVDDFGSLTCPGIVEAVREYLGQGHEFQQWRLQAEQVVLIRR